MASETSAKIAEIGPRGRRGKIVYQFLMVLVSVGLLPLGIVAHKLIDISREALVTSQQDLQLQRTALAPGGRVEPRGPRQKDASRSEECWEQNRVCAERRDQRRCCRPEREDGGDQDGPSGREPPGAGRRYVRSRNRWLQSSLKAGIPLRIGISNVPE